MPLLALSSVDGTSRTMRMQVICDGVTVFDSTSAAFASGSRGAVVVGNIDNNYRVFDGDPIRRLPGPLGATSTVRECAEAFVDGIEPRVAARQIAEVIGLTPRDAEAVVALRAKLEAAGPGTLVKAGKVRIRIPADGIDAELIDLRVSQYAGRLLRARALNIARTETLAAANAGQTELWRAAETSGLLQPGATRVWLVTPDDRLCKECMEMDGQVRGLNQPFTSSGGAEIDSPPLHSSCRCATGLNHAN